MRVGHLRLHIIGEPKAAEQLYQHFDEVGDGCGGHIGMPLRIAFVRRHERDEEDSGSYRAQRGRGFGIVQKRRDPVRAEKDDDAADDADDDIGGIRGLHDTAHIPVPA